MRSLKLVVSQALRSQPAQTATKTGSGTLWLREAEALAKWHDLWAQQAWHTSNETLGSQFAFGNFT